MNFAQLLAKVTGFESQMTALSDQVATLESQLKTQTQKSEALETDVSGLKNELKTVQNEKAELETQATEASAKVETLTAENSDLKSQLDDPKGAIQKAASQQAQNIIASTGTPPVETDNKDEASASGQSIQEEYMSITDPGKRQQFFIDNHDKLSRALAAQLN